MSQNPGPEKARFVWPPARPPVQVHTAAAEVSDDSEIIPPRNAPAPVGLRAALLEFERVWLGLTRPPLADRIAAANWRPNSAEVYCSRCGSTSDVRGAPCDWCRQKKAVPWERIIRLGEFNGLLREVVHEVKFTRWRKLGTDMGRILGQSMKLEIESGVLNGANAVLVPVPMSLTRRLTRGIDHAMVIARGVSEVTGLPIVQALQRRHTRTQVGLGTKARQANVAAAFHPVPGVHLGGLTAILVDDVTTTRATLRAACKAISLGHKDLGNAHPSPPPRIWAAVLAVTPQDAIEGV